MYEARHISEIITEIKLGWAVIDVLPEKMRNDMLCDEKIFKAIEQIEQFNNKKNEQRN